MSNPIIGITGTTGFIGSAVLDCAVHRSVSCIPLLRDKTTVVNHAACTRILGNCDGRPFDPNVLRGCTTIIHIAARAHVIEERDPNPRKTFRQVNAESTALLAKASILAGVRQFIFISSIGVLGNKSNDGPLVPTQNHRPVEDYAKSKAEAENLLLTIAKQSGLRVVIIRPPLVHGPGAKGNFNRLMQAIWEGKRFPLRDKDNRRSFVGVQNLAEAILKAAVTNSSALGEVQTYHLADDGVISTRRLIEVLAEGMGVKPRFISVPRWLVIGGATMLGKGAMARRLFDDLEVDDSDFRRDFGWKPRHGLEDGLRLMAQEFKRRQETNKES